MRTKLTILLFPVLAVISLMLWAADLAFSVGAVEAQDYWVTGAELHQAGQAEFGAYTNYPAEPGLGIFTPSTGCENPASVLPSEEFIDGQHWEHFIVIEIDPPIYANKFRLTGQAVDYDQESQQGREPSYEVGFNHDQYRYNFTGAMGNECQTNEFAFLPRFITQVRLYCVDIWNNINPEKCGFHGFALLTEIAAPVFTVFLPLIQR